MDTLTTILAVYGAGLSTLIFAREILIKRSREKGRIKVEFNVAIQVQTGLTSMPTSKRYLQFKITNVGFDVRQVNRPQLRICKTNETLMVMGPPNPQSSDFPIRLDRGQQA